MHKPHDNLAVMHDAREKGIVAIPCHPLTKVPMVRWKMWQTLMPPLEVQEEWFADPNANIAVICKDTVTYDCDDPALVDRVLAECGDTPDRVLTPSGGQHLTYRLRAGAVLSNTVDVLGIELDIRTNKGVRVIPNSRTEKGEYRWVNEKCCLHAVADLPCGNYGWTRPRKKKRVQSVVVESSPDIMVRRARAWLACVEGAISGQGGHGRTFRVACKLTHPFPQGFGLSFDQAWPLMKEWNEQCEPPWSDAELTHKLVDAAGKIR